MRIAVTADLHLRQSNPERLENFEQLITQLLSREIHLLIIAGDLLDSAGGSAGSPADGSYAKVDSLAGRFPEMQLLILPGNHDADLQPGMFAAKNIHLFTKPTLKRIDRRLFLFLPFRGDSTIGETIAGLEDSELLRSNPWILISHGDFTAPRPRESGQERGYYPLTREDMARYRPAKVILGHIHVPNSPEEDVLYPGSPYPLSSDEYGQRRVLVLDTATAGVDELLLSHPPLYLRADIFLIPDGREQDQIRIQLQRNLANSHSERIAGNLQVQVVVKGYTSDRSKVQGYIETLLSDSGVTCSGIDLEALRVNDDKSLATVAEAVQEQIKKLELDYEEAQSLRQAVLEKALAMVYGA